MSPEAVALLSGGLDSVVATTATLRETGVRLSLTFDYGQRSAQRELDSASAVAKDLGIEWKAVELPWLAELLPASLAEQGTGPPGVARSDLDDADDAMRRAETVWIPNRNGVFLNIAASFAESLGADSVVAGFNREEADAFPDNSRAFMERATAALELSTMSHVGVVSPTVGMTKSEIVKLGVKLGAPLIRIWSCYEGGEGMCGRCESCARLLRALHDAGTPHESWPRALPRRD